MRVLAIFALFQIAGILSSPVHPDRTRIEERRNMELVRSFILDADFYILLFGLRNAELVDDTTAENGIQWNLSNGTDADNATIQNVETFLNSVVKLSNNTYVQLRAAFDAPHGGLDSTIEIACHSLTTTNSLIKNLTHSLKSYWSPGESATADLILNISTELLQYICQNNGTRVSAFLAADGEDCLHSSENEISSCVETSFSSNTSVINEPRPFNIPWNLPIITLNTQACREFGKFQECTVSVLKRCQNPTPSDHVNSLLNIVKSSSGCEVFGEAEIL